MNLRDTWFLVHTGVWYLLRSRDIWMWAVVLPVVFFYFIGTITSSWGGVSNDQDPIAVLQPSDAGFLAGELIARLQGLSYKTVVVSRTEDLQPYRRRLTLPPAFTATVLGGKPVKIEFDRTGEDIGADYDRVRLNRAVYSVVADLIAATRDGSPATPEAFRRLAATPRRVTMEVKPAGKREEAPGGFEQSVPGSLVFFVTIVLFTGTAANLVIERDRGILRRLGTSPMSRNSVLAGKFGARFTVGAVQIAFALLTGSALFKVHWGRNLPVVVVVLLAYASLATAGGLLLGTLARTQRQAAGIGVLSSNLLAAIGGCWWPAEVMPRWMQSVSRATPSGLTMHALHQLVNFGAPPSAVVWHIVILSASALVVAKLAARSFRFQ